VKRVEWLVESLIERLERWTGETTTRGRRGGRYCLEMKNSEIFTRSESIFCFLADACCFFCRLSGPFSSSSSSMISAESIASKVVLPFSCNPSLPPRVLIYPGHKRARIWNSAAFCTSCVIPLATRQQQYQDSPMGSMDYGDLKPAPKVRDILFRTCPDVSPLNDFSMSRLPRSLSSSSSLYSGSGSGSGTAENIHPPLTIISSSAPGS
jgi:hypothetical protein